MASNTSQKRKKCNFVPYDWMSVEYLKEVVEEQRQSKEFILLPFHYVEIFLLYRTNAQENIPNFRQVSSLMADLQEMRQVILKEFLKVNAPNTTSFYLVNICHFELLTVHHHVTNVQKTCHDWLKTKNELIKER
eukprot:UN30146